MLQGTAAGLVLAGALVACSAGEEESQPPPTTRPRTTTSVVDLAGVALPPVGGATTTTAPRESGDATIRGTVSGPSGPVAGATVRLERFHGDDVTGRDVLTDGAGRFEVRGVPGGRYRIRAWAAPALVQVEPVVAFLADRQEHGFELRVEDRGGLDVRTDVAPNPPVVGGRVHLAVRVGVREVDDGGVLHTHPRGDVRVELGGLGRWRSVDGEQEPTRATDAAGVALFVLECETAGDPGLFVRIPVRRAAPGGATGSDQVTVEALPLELPPCAAPVSSPPAEPPGTTDGDGSSTGDAGDDEDGGDDGDGAGRGGR